MQNLISATIVADSLSPNGHRVTTFELVFPRIILAEAKTHRLLYQNDDELIILSKNDSINSFIESSKNSASSRAIPFSKMVKSVMENPFIPIAWQKDHSGMQGNEYITDPAAIQYEIDDHLYLRDEIVRIAELKNKRGVSKQLCNRYLEPFAYHKIILTTTEEGLENFFKQRCPKYVFHNEEQEFCFRSKIDVTSHFGGEEPVEYSHGNVSLKDLTNLDWLQLNKGSAEIHMMDLSEKMLDVYNTSKPQQLISGQWHIPYGHKILISGTNGIEQNTLDTVKISTAMCARVSYTTIGEEKEMTYKKLIEIHDKILAADPPHWSPTEHCCVATDSSDYFYNIQGFKSYRYELQNQSI